MVKYFALLFLLLPGISLAASCPTLSCNNAFNVAYPYKYNCDMMGENCSNLAPKAEKGAENPCQYVGNDFSWENINIDKMNAYLFEKGGGYAAVDAFVYKIRHAGLGRNAYDKKLYSYFIKEDITLKPLHSSPDSAGICFYRFGGNGNIWIKKK